LQQTKIKIMKKILFAALVLAFAYCTKDDAPKCNTCTVLLANSEAYSYKVSFKNWTGAPNPFTLKPGESKTITAPTGVAIMVVGDFQTPYAHNDFSKSFYCPGDCGMVSVVLEQ